jgi:hypothetical protein
MRRNTPWVGARRPIWAPGLGTFRDWIRARRRRDFAALLALAGCIMMALGITGL